MSLISYKDQHVFVVCCLFWTAAERDTLSTNTFTDEAMNFYEVLAIYDGETLVIVLASIIL